MAPEPTNDAYMPPVFEALFRQFRVHSGDVDFARRLEMKAQSRFGLSLQHRPRPLL
jgi:hypothetical protein